MHPLMFMNLCSMNLNNWRIMNGNDSIDGLSDTFEEVINLKSKKLQKMSSSTLTKKLVLTAKKKILLN